MSDASTASRQYDEKVVDLAIKRYDTLLRYYAYENTIYWNRSQFFLVGNVGLFAVYAAIFERQPAGAGALACVGFGLSLLWLRILKSSEYWTSRWERICCGFEEVAFGGVEVLRNCRPAKGHTSTKRSARISATVSILLWSAGLIAALYHAWPGLFLFSAG